MPSPSNAQEHTSHGWIRPHQARSSCGVAPVNASAAGTINDVKPAYTSGGCTRMAQCSRIGVSPTPSSAGISNVANGSASHWVTPANAATTTPAAATAPGGGRRPRPTAANNVVIVVNNRSDPAIPPHRPMIRS